MKASIKSKLCKIPSEIIVVIILAIAMFVRTSYQFMHPPKQPSEFDIGNNGILIGYHGTQKTLVFPAKIKSMMPDVCRGNMDVMEVSFSGELKELGSGAFEKCPNLRRVVLPKNMTSIGAAAFSFCDKLLRVEMPDTINKIDSNAFYKCSSLELDTLPADLTELGVYTFYGCHKITKLTIPDGVEELPDNVFGNCRGLREITIPSTVTTIHKLAFAGADNVTFCCDTESAAEQFAKKANIPVKLLQK